MFKGDLDAGKPVSVQLAADSSNPGTVSYGFFFMLEGKKKSGSTLKMVASGATDGGDPLAIPSDAERFEVDPQIPAGCKAVLTVSQPGGATVTDTVTGSEPWTFDVQ